jgi:tetratricopeptide (TPR) repeat protein
MWYEWDWGAAEKGFRRALELNPNLLIAHEFYGHFLILMGRFDEAISEFKRAQQLDPLSPAVNTELGWPYWFDRQYDKAIQQWQKALELDPNFPIAHYNIGAELTKLGRYEEAIAECQKAVAADKQNPFFLAVLGYSYAVGGKRKEALQILADLHARAETENVPVYFFAMLYVGLKENDKAIAALEKGFDERDSTLVVTKTDPFLDPLRSDPRFQALLRRMNFPP